VRIVEIFDAKKRRILVEEGREEIGDANNKVWRLLSAKE